MNVVKVVLALITLISSSNSLAECFPEQRCVIVWDIHDVLVYKDHLAMTKIAAQLLVQYGPHLVTNFVKESAAFLWHAHPGPLLKTITGCVKLILSGGSSDQYKSVIASYNPTMWNHIVELLTAQRPDPKMVALVQRLALRGYSQWIASNIGPDEYQMLKDRHPELFSHLTLGKIVDERRYPGVKKPHQRFFQEFVQTTGLYPEEILFIDDQAANVATAQIHSWRSLMFVSYEQLITDLNRLHILDADDYEGFVPSRETISEAI